MDLPRFGTDGVRGVANTELTPEVAMALGRAAAEILGGDRVVIGSDSRRSGPMLEAALVAGVTSAGLDVELLGVVPTPAVAWVAADQDMAGAMISASHNPFADNGIKLFARGGLKLGDAVERAIEQRFHALLGGAERQSVTGEAVGVAYTSDAADKWAAAVAAAVTRRAGPQPFSGLTVVIDCANGAASGLAPGIFRELGTELHVIGDSPNGVNINESIGSTHPEQLQAAVQQVGADLGLAFDGDADRLIAVDDRGRIVDGDHVLAILAADMQATGRLTDNTLVVTVMSNMGLRLAMSAIDVEVVETGVGDRYVLEALNSGGYSLGGEQSGHVILRDVSTTGDGVLAGVHLLEAVVRADSSLATMADEAMTSLPQVLRNVRLHQRDPAIVDRLGEAVAAAEEDLGSDGRVLVRPSGTEPLVRVMVEHSDQATASRVCDALVVAAEALTSQ